MNTREEVVRKWFTMWLENDVIPINDIFAEDVTYSESWGPEYNGIEAVRYWFVEWNKRGKVYIWNIKQFIHQDNKTAVEWYFRNQMNDGTVENFDGVSIIEWNENNQIKSLKEFGSKLPHYNPYVSNEE